MTSRDDCLPIDCLVIGGGPAGSAVAMLLARRGHRIVLVDHGRAHHSGPNETLLATSLPLLQRIGMEPTVLAAATVDPLRHGAVWGSDRVEWQTPSAPGLWLQRGPFDAALRRAAARQGVDVRCPASWRHVDTDRFAIGVEGEAEAFVQPRHVILATGRSRVASQPAPTVACGPATRAFTFVGVSAPDDRGTALVEAVPQGWIWTHALANGRTSAAVVCDAEAAAGTRRRNWLLAALAAARGPASRLQQARLAHANDATARLLPAHDEWLRVGDAAATIDPMASQGVEKALAAAEHAALVVHTALEQRSWWPRLRALHAQWEAMLFHAHRRLAGDFYRREQRFPAQPFWRRRHEGTLAQSQLPLPETPLVVHDAVVVGRVLVRRDDSIVETDGASDARSQHSLSHIGYVPVPALLGCFALATPLPVAAQQAGSHANLFVLPPRAVHGAMVELLRLGWLTPATNATAPR